MDRRSVLSRPFDFFRRSRLSGLLSRIFRNAILRNVFAYSFAIAIVWFIARDVPLHQLLGALAGANLWIFIPVSLFGIAMWFLDETVL